MKHRDRLTNRVALELAFPVGNSCVFQPLYQDSRELISILQLFRSPANTASEPSLPPPVSPLIQAYVSCFQTQVGNSTPISPAVVERFSPIHF